MFDSTPSRSATTMLPATGGIQLRGYQREAVDAIFDYFESPDGTGNPLAVLPTGSGKSLILADFVAQTMQAWPDQRILACTHVGELVEQDAKALFSYWPGAPAGIYSAHMNSRDLSQPVTFASIQSVIHRVTELGHVDLLIVDEAHLIPPKNAGQYRTLIDALAKVNPRLRVIGLTATPWRLGQGRLIDGDDALFHAYAYELPVRRLIDEGWLSPLTTGPVRERVNLEGVKVRQGEFAAGDLQQRMRSPDKMHAVVQQTCEMAADRKGWLVFAAGVEHAEELAALFRATGVTTGCITGRTPKAERERFITEYRAQRLRCLVNVSVLTTGFDAPHTDALAFARPTMSPVLWSQMLGRGMRLSPETGKTDCLVLDFAGNLERLGPVDDIRPPRAPGKRDEPGDAPAKMCDQCGALMHLSARECGDCGHPFPDPEKHRNITRSASVAEAMKGERGVEIIVPTRANYDLHEKPGRPASVRVTYYAGLHRICREWVCFGHEGFARGKAVDWWRKRVDGEVPSTAQEALERQHEIALPEKLRVDFRGKFPEIVGAVVDKKGVAK
ncbi:DEAD/DEAH box helicase [Algiphilus sp.]|uniref:DEAD/DEAH box helicase n=1 Tax=Algiphilus sp. TaxID=1872431 RepID=UPI003BADA8F5